MRASKFLFRHGKKWETAKEENNFEKKNPSRPVPWLLLDPQKKECFQEKAQNEKEEKEIR